MGKLDDFLNAPSAVQQSGNTPWARKYSLEVTRVIRAHAARTPRTLQVHLGPSELGAICDRSVAAKMARVPSTNHVGDPWASIMGTAGHAWMDEAFTAENLRQGVARFLTETRVTPHPNHPGTSDLYDAAEQTVIDWKFVGPTSLETVRSAEGPPRHYVVQLLLYALGFRNLGLPVGRVALVALPRTKSNLNDIYTWERVHTPADEELLEQVFQDTERRRLWALALMSGRAQLNDIPISPSKYCLWCSQYRPQAAYDGGTGCPGQLEVRK